ncbi:hypothetical protein V495_04454 [Pseudogymnoascus sp. VKM F-4514 (FW-929)]|nr:hypothetical protein V495_04454 [Pseudogymnoascus sp. VKM F-4514 (FW-929)]KFY56968.1 hypothetical protein V497_05859 [Pseudogymnoascus sp. VKM F-4516 (FW-969)]
MRLTLIQFHRLKVGSLRDERHRDDPETIEERPPLQGVRFHIAAWVSSWGEAETPRFYNAEENMGDEPVYAQKPRRRLTTEEKHGYTESAREWGAGKHCKVGVKV